MKQSLLTIIAVLVAITLAMFSIDTAGYQYSSRSYRTYSYHPDPDTRSGDGDETPSLLRMDNTDNSSLPMVETITNESFPPLMISNSPLGTPPAMLETSAMAELTPSQLPPLDAGMVNVTGGVDENMQTAGYRVKPMPGEFAIAVPYDPELLPQGFTEDDIQTYVYDRQYHRWVAIQRDSVNEAELLVCSRFRPWEKGLSHTRNDLSNPQDALAQVQDIMSFAPQGGGGDSPLDFINAVLKTPEMPETSAYTPTSIKELKAADPLEGITLIQPPTANNSGTANLSYPIEIPAGRQGMQPNLALTYSSSGGNGWLGVGWDISIPSITVETRWGVPRYRTAWESEVYLYEGEQLVTKDNVTGGFRKLAHRTNDTLSISRLSGNIQHFPRKNEAHDSIVRHGSGPDNYWWTVTHKNGVTDYYGKYASDNGVNNSCVLRTGAGNSSGAIAHWALAESVDPSGNSVRYYYSVLQHPGVNNASVMGKQIYIDSIRYTYHEDAPSRYKIHFVRKGGRDDVTVSFNRGFKEVTAEVLCYIEISFDEEVLRRYMFYTENKRKSQYKTRLTDVVRIDSINDFHYCDTELPMLEQYGFFGVRTNFDYFDAPSGNAMFSDTVSIDLHTSNDNLHSFFITNPFNVGNEGKASALGATKGKSWNIGGTATIGLGPVVPLTSLSVGGNFNYSRSKSEGILTLADLDGDGLADKLFKSGDTLYCRKQIFDSDTTFHFGPAKPVVGASDFLVEGSSTTAWGLQASAGCSYSGSWPKTTSTTSVYFSDVNGDGLMDLITDKGVLFNVTEKGNDTVKFKEFYTMAIANGEDEIPDIVVTHPGVCGGIIFDGAVNDSVACTVEWELVGQFNIKNIGGSSHAAALADSLMNTGMYECVFRYPHYDSTGVDYQSETGLLEIYRKSIRCTPVPADPDLETVKVWVVQRNGTVNVRSRIQLLNDSSESHAQSKRCDGVQYAIQVCRDVNVDGQYRLFSSTTPEILVRDTIPDSVHVMHDTTVAGVYVSEGDIIMFRLISGENRSFDKVKWNQDITYTSFGNDSVVQLDAYSMNANHYNSEQDYLVSGKMFFQAHKNNSRYAMTIDCLPRPNSSDTAILTVVLFKDSILTQIPYLLRGNQSRTINMGDSLNENDFIRFILVATNYGSFDVRPHIQYMFPDTINGNPVTDTVHYYPPVQAIINNYKQTALDTVYHWLFGPLYRGWGQFAYNNNDTVAGMAVKDTVIKLSRLVVDLRAHPTDQSQAQSDSAAISTFQPTQETDKTQEQSTMTQAFTSSGAYDPLSPSTGWVEMQPDSRHGAWVGYGNINYIVRDTISNTRMPEYVADSITADIVEYDHPVPVVPQGFEAKTIRKQNMTKLKNHSLSLSIPVVPISIGVSRSTGDNTILTDYMDLNGDRYPDIIGQAYVQYSQPWGGIGPIRTLATHVQVVSSSSTISEGANFGGSYSTPSRNTSNNPKGAKISFNGSGNAGVSLGGGSDHTSFTWMDVNGDGLPDKVNALGSVALNCGYGFLPFEKWGVTAVREGNSRNFGTNFGGSFNIGQASIGGGVGLNVSRNSTNRMLSDFNGDGLPDIVETSGSGLRVMYNKGAGRWSGWETVSTIPFISYGNSYSESLDLSVTLGFTFWSILKVCVGISGSPYGKSFSKDSVQLTDINGDGYVDYVTSSSENSMTVRYNRSGKTNLLKKVTNFTGSTMEMDYVLSRPCYEKPQRSWNLDTLAVEDPNSSLAGSVSHTKFVYEDPRYDRYERMDYGYARVTTREHDTDRNDTLYRYTVEEYNNRDFIKRGRKTRDCVYDADNKPYVEHLYDAVVHDFTGSVVADGSCARNDVYVAKESVITNWYEGLPSPQITSVVMRVYDRHRNVTEYTHCGDTTHFGEWFRAEIDYAEGMPLNMTALPVQIIVKNHAGNTIQKRTASYDGKGRLLELARYNTGGAASLYNFAYDTCGNMIQAVLPKNDSNQRINMAFYYDTVVRSYPVKVVNASLGYLSTADYDYRFGKPTKTVDINGNEMRYAYDQAGRNVMILAPNEKDAGAPYTIRMEYRPKNYALTDIFGYNAGKSYAITSHYDCQHPGNPIRTTLITDGLGRLLQTKKDAEINGQEVSLVTGKVTYDCFGRTVEQYHPFVEPLGTESIYNDSLTAGTATVTEYDILDRPRRVELPTHEETLTEYGFETYGGRTLFRTTITDAMGNIVRILKGTMGQQIKQAAPYNTETLFEYDCLGRLTKSTDPDGFQTTYEYDMLGQMFHRNHPDAGDDYYEYDLAGNLVQHFNGEGEGVYYSYRYNQLTDISYSQYPANNVHYTYGTNADTAINAAGKVMFRKDASGWQTYKYGKLGEVTENIRTFALPYENQTYTFKMQYEYDSWNRIQNMTYPDGEVVSYKYDRGGMLDKVTGHKDNADYTYVEGISYNRFGLKDTVWYGNNTQTEYVYDTLQRLKVLISKSSAYPGTTGLMQNIEYTYDRVGNITYAENTAPALPNGLGGSYINYHEYDNLYRLVYSTGAWNGVRPVSYEAQMAYHDNGRMAGKEISASSYEQTPYLNNLNTVAYHYDYYYQNAGQPNTLTQIGPAPGQQFWWDGKGNMVQHKIPDKLERSLCWDEQNRLMGVADKQYLSLYQYDADGERTYKLTGELTHQNVSGNWSSCYQLDNATLYASPYLVATSKGYTKHYYAENERVASRIGGGGLGMISVSIVEPDTFSAKKEANVQHAKAVTQCLTDKDYKAYPLLEGLYYWKDILQAESDCYWYHPDHLGSSSWITYTDGSAVQHLHYMPWGEDFVNQRTTDYAARFTFSAKEKDSETGFSYFGSRYYSSDLSIWLSVDPMSDKYPSTSPYAYCRNNPIILMDPNGEEVIVSGSGSEDVKTQINNMTSKNFKVSLGSDGKMTYSGKAKTKTDKFVKNAIDRSDITINIDAENDKKSFTSKTDGKQYDYKKEDDGIICTGAYGGSEYANGHATSYQYVDPNRSAKLDKKVGDNVAGGYMLHEFAEGYYSADIALGNKKGDPISVGSNYNEAHNKANSISGGNWTHSTEYMTLPNGKKVQSYNGLRRSPISDF